MIEFKIRVLIWWFRLCLRFSKLCQLFWFFRLMETTTITWLHISFWLVAWVELSIWKSVVIIWCNLKRQLLQFKKLWTRNLGTWSCAGKTLHFGLWLLLPFLFLDIFLTSCKIRKMFLEKIHHIQLWDRHRVFWFWSISSPGQTCLKNWETKCLISKTLKMSAREPRSYWLQ